LYAFNPSPFIPFFSVRIALIQTDFKMIADAKFWERVELSENFIQELRHH